jgi:hypothetical protein
MSITPSVPVLRGRKNTALEFDGSELVLRRAAKEHRIPLAAVAAVRAGRRSVEVVLTAAPGTAPAVHRIEDVGETAARAFAGAVGAALPPESDRAADGTALVTVRTVDAERARARKRLWGWLGTLAFLLVHGVLGLLAAADGPPELVLVVGVGAFCTGVFLLAALRCLPFGKPSWRLATDGITVIARYDGFVDGMHLYKFADLTGRPYAYAPRDYRGEQVEVIYDPGDPFNGVERQFLLGRGIMLLPLCFFGALALVCFLLTVVVALAS